MFTWQIITHTYIKKHTKSKSAILNLMCVHWAVMLSGKLPKTWPNTTANPKHHFLSGEAKGIQVENIRFLFNSLQTMGLKKEKKKYIYISQSFWMCTEFIHRKWLWIFLLRWNMKYWVIFNSLVFCFYLFVFVFSFFLGKKKSILNTKINTRVTGYRFQTECSFWFCS